LSVNKDDIHSTKGQRICLIIIPLSDFSHQLQKHNTINQRGTKKECDRLALGFLSRKKWSERYAKWQELGQLLCMIKHGTWRLQELHIMRDETDEENLVVNHSDLDADQMPESCKADFLEHLKSES
jgi:hypothetical protein